MLAAQAKFEKMPLATVDILLKDFPVEIFMGEKAWYLFVDGLSNPGRKTPPISSKTVKW